MNATSRAVIPVTLSLLVGLTACSAPTPHQEAAPKATAASHPSATPTEAAPAAGTRENPIPVDTLTEYDPASQWRFSVGATDGDANAEITKDDEYVDIPEGKVFVAAPFYVQVKDTGSADGAEPGLSLIIEYVTSTGNSFPTDGVDCYGEGHLYGVGKMFPGAEARATICAAVPTDGVIGGTWRVTSASKQDTYIFLDGAN